MYMRMPRTCLRLCGKKGYEGYDDRKEIRLIRVPIITRLREYLHLV